MLFRSADPQRRAALHNDLTFSLTYAYSENFILPLSHDEVVHGKCSLLSKMPGLYHDKFANLRAYLTYLFCHPGKKLTFMGADIAQFIEWDEERGLDFFLLDYEMHAKYNRFIQALNTYYKKSAPLWENDSSIYGFEWIACDDKDKNTVGFVRRDNKGGEINVFCNFSTDGYTRYRFGVGQAGSYRCVFSTDEEEYGGSSRMKRTVKTQNLPLHGKAQSLQLDLPPLSVLIYQRKGN